MADTINLTGLDKLLKMLKQSSKPYVRVGILGSDGSKVHQPEEKEGESKSAFNESKTNALPTIAEIGAAHEYGTEILPVRSFLRVPLTTNLDKDLKKSGLLDKETFDEVLKEGSVMPWLTKVGISAVGVVMDAFKTGGNGTWKPSDMRRKKVHQTLVETQQLLESITFEVKGGE